ncbi:hypothetical protein [uncultured Clostridium sp.]|uniref:hypothetical protein n=1 Tax=uncultured Clostridium sp. TaxID=59620 RepID=UPI0026050AA7|nr:hypothetical protein [uncultured Clostridium sp.]
MRHYELEKKVSRLDRDLEALRIAKKHLSNADEINEAMDYLNQERQVVADELYFEDAKSYIECCERIRPLLDQELNEKEQGDLLEEIKQVHGRRLANVTRKTFGLNAWLKFMDMDAEWISNDGENWSTLVIREICVREQ